MQCKCKIQNENFSLNSSWERKLLIPDKVHQYLLHYIYSPRIKKQNCRQTEQSSKKKTFLRDTREEENGWSHEAERLLERADRKLNRAGAFSKEGSFPAPKYVTFLMNPCGQERKRGVERGWPFYSAIHLVPQKRRDSSRVKRKYFSRRHALETIQRILVALPSFLPSFYFLFVLFWDASRIVRRDSGDKAFDRIDTPLECIFFFRTLYTFTSAICTIFSLTRTRRILLSLFSFFFRQVVRAYVVWIVIYNALHFIN